MRVISLNPVCFLSLILCVIFSPLARAQVPPQGAYWLQLNGFSIWEWDVDHDGDGLTLRAEYFAGTDPRNPQSRIYPVLEKEDNDLQLSWNSAQWARYQILSSPNLRDFQGDQDSIFFTTGSEFMIGIEPTDLRKFFVIDPLPSLDSDHDGLTDREEAILGTDYLDDDTDDDTLIDGAEIFENFTDPLVFDPLGGVIEGTAFLTETLGMDLTNAVPLAGATIFLDQNFNGFLDEGEPRQVTDENGGYRFVRLRPGIYEVRQVLVQGDTQTIPAEVTPVVPNGLADEVLEYTHAPGVLPEAYGYAPLDDYPALDVVILGREIVPVDPALLLLPIGARPVNPPIGSYPRSHHLALPENASVTVRFDETIVDLEGPDFVVSIPRQGNGAGGGEPATYFIGPNEDELVEFDQSVLLGDSQPSVTPVDLADFPEVPFVRVIRVVSGTTGDALANNVDGGYGLAGFQALNYLPLTSSAYRVEILGTETVNRTFGRFFQDLPPQVLVQGSTQPQVGRPVTLTFIPTDDLGVPNLSVTVNGSEVILNDSNAITVNPSFPGELRFSATVTDSAGQATTENWTYIILTTEGELPYDPQDLAEQQGVGLTSLRIFSPEPGEVPSEDLTVVGSVIPPSGQAVNWTLEIAPIADIDLDDLAANDPDFLTLSSGNSAVYSDALGDLDLSEYETGVYLLRLSATPAGGGLSNFLGQAIGIGVDEAGLRPVIEIITPERESQAEMVQDVVATLTSAREITSWKAEVASYEAVDLAALGAESASWSEIGSGTGTFTEASLGMIDTTTLRNGRYLLRVSAFNDLRLGRVEAVEFEVAGNSKPGRNRRVFTDSEIALAGFPLRIERVYDSIDADRSGDFGFGWSLSVGDPDLFETVPNTGVGLFGATPFRSGTRVYLTAPDGQRLAFTFEPEFAQGGLFQISYRATFVPDPGNPYQLSVPEGDDPFLTVKPDGSVALLFVGFPWNPSSYFLTAPDGVVHTYHQDKGILSSENPSGASLRYTPEGIVHSSGLALLFERDQAGRITSITEPGGGSWTYSYSAEGDLSAVLPPAKTTPTTFTYRTDFAHFLDSVIDPAGRVGFRFEYDENGRLSATYDEFGNKAEQSWDPLARTGTLTSPRGFITTLVYDDRGNVIRETDPLGNVIERFYEDERHPDLETKVVTPNTVERYRYDEVGNRLATVFSDGNNFFFGDLRFQYDDFGNATTEMQVGGRTIVRMFDDLGRLSRVEGYAVRSTDEETRTYAPNGEVETIRRNGEDLRVVYDEETGLKMREEGLEGFVRQYRYTDVGRPERVINSLGEETVISYDDANGSATVTYPNGAQLSSTYVEENGEATLTETDAFGASSSRTLDSELNVLEETLKGGVMVLREYDESRNLTSLTTPGGQENTFEYDALDRQTSFTDAADQTHQVSYDAEGRVIEKINRNGKRITYLYNARSQVSSEIWHEGVEIIKRFDYTYVGGNSRLTSVTDGENTWDLGTVNIGGIADRFTFAYANQESFTLTYSYLNGRLEVPSQLSLRTGLRVTSRYVGPRPYAFQYELPSITLDDGSTQGSSVSVRHRYNTEGYLTSLERYDFLTTSQFNAEPVSVTNYTHLPAGAVGGIEHLGGDGMLAFPESQMTFTRDPAHQITGRVQPGNNSTYTYDLMGQLTGATHSGFPDRSFAYDVAGNDTTEASAYGADNRLLTRGDLTFTYDAEGNVTSQRNTVTGEEKIYTYDHRNQLVSVSTRPDQVTDPVVVAEFAYDYRGRMMSRTLAGNTTYLLWDRDTVFAEFEEGADDVSKVYLYDLAEPLRRIGEWTAEGGARFFLTDQVGSVNGVVARDGAPLHWVDYDSFGEPRTAVPNEFGPVRFAGRYWIEEAGLYQNSLRYYDPALRRFLQQDPIRYEGGDYNLYRYVGNNPLSFTDPNGKSALNEYGQLVKRVAGCVKKLKGFGECVDNLLGGAARAVEAVVNGGGGGGAAPDVNCAIKNAGKTCVK